MATWVLCPPHQRVYTAKSGITHILTDTAARKHILIIECRENQAIIFNSYLIYSHGITAPLPELYTKYPALRVGIKSIVTVDKYHGGKCGAIYEFSLTRPRISNPFEGSFTSYALYCKSSICGLKLFSFSKQTKIGSLYGGVFDSRCRKVVYKCGIEHATSLTPSTIETSNVCYRVHECVITAEIYPNCKKLVLKLTRNKPVFVSGIPIVIITASNLMNSTIHIEKVKKLFLQISTPDNLILPDVTGTTIYFYFMSKIPNFDNIVNAKVVIRRRGSGMTWRHQK